MWQQSQPIQMPSAEVRDIIATRGRGPRQERMDMKNSNKFLPVAAAILATASATPATAQGARIEVHGGWDRLQSEGVKGNGLLYGIGAGYDIAVAPNITIGAEVNADFSTGKKCETAVLAANDKLCVRARRDLSAVGRLGFGVAPGSQLYLLAGYTNAKVSAAYTPPTGAAIKESATADGLRLGGGFQQSLGGSAYTKVEYRYSNYEADTVRHQVVAGFGFRF